MPVWEYKVVHVGYLGFGQCFNGKPSEEILCKFGEKGWELTSVVATSDNEAIAYLKRPVQR